MYTRLSFTTKHLDVWFDSDSRFIFGQITDRFSPHNDTNGRHPIFVLLTYPFVELQTHLLGISKSHAALATLLTYSSLCVTAMYAALRLINRPVGVALIFTGVFLASTSGLLFLGIYERLIPGGLTILICVIAFLLYERRVISANVLTLAAALTLGVTVSNFMVGAAALLLALGVRRGVQACINAFVVVQVLNLIVLFAFPASAGFMDIRTWPWATTAFSGNQEHLIRAGTLSQKASVFFFHALVMPKPEVVNKPPPWSEVRYLSTEKAGITRYQTSGYLALALWLVLLGLGASELLRRGFDARVRLLLGWGVLCQLALFLFWGSEIILFSPYYVPALILIASLVWNEVAGIKMLALPLVFLALLLWNNVQMFCLSRQLALSLIGS